FFVQGTPAAMLKLDRILSHFAEHDDRSPWEAAKGKAREDHADFLFRDPTDARDGGNQDSCYIPGHIVRATYKLPLDWFFNTPRPRRTAVVPLRYPTPPSYEGSIEGFKDILKPEK